jgi:hypothetical protein
MLHLEDRTTYNASDDDEVKVHCLAEDNVVAL